MCDSVPFRPFLGVRPARLLALLLLPLAAAGLAEAAAFRAGDLVVVAEGEVVADDLYATGSTVEIRGRVEGDVVAAAATVEVAGEVTGDLIAAASTVRVDGRVGDDARLSGGLVRVDGAVVGDLVGSGASVELGEAATVGGDLATAAGQVLLAGDVAGDVRLGAGAAELRGAVEGEVHAEVGGRRGVSPAIWPGVPDELSSVPDGFTFGPDARVGGDLTLVAPGEPPVATERVGGAYRFEPDPGPTPRSPAIRIVERYLLLLLVGAAVWALAPRWTSGSADRVTGAPAASGLLGAAVLVGAPFALALVLAALGAVAAVAALANLPGLSVGLVFVGVAVVIVLGVLLALALSIVAPAVVGLTVGRWLLSRSEGAAAAGLGALALGLLLVALVTWLPGVGALLGLLVAAFGIGAGLAQAWAGRRRGSGEAGEVSA
jgi:cytoskeletal protein CcmA (bactofilin family)